MRLYNGLFAFTTLLLIGFSWTNRDGIILLPWLHLVWFLCVRRSRPNISLHERIGFVVLANIFASVACLSVMVATKHSPWFYYPLLLLDAAFCLNTIANSAPASLNIKGLQPGGFKRIRAANATECTMDNEKGA